MKFEILEQSGAARTGRLTFRRGTVRTPAFMPVGTYGSVKSVTPEEVAAERRGDHSRQYVSPDVAPGHRHRPQARRPARVHELARTDPDGLGRLPGVLAGGMRKLTEEGVTFRSPVNGDEVFLTPEKSMDVQHELNADVTMMFDECTPYPAIRKRGPRIHAAVAALGRAQPAALRRAQGCRARPW